jgi:isopenicillin-N epimerase
MCCVDRLNPPQMVAIPAPPQEADTLRRRLFEASRIEIPVTTHGGRVFLRLSVQGVNTGADIQHPLAASALQ